MTNLFKVEGQTLTPVEIYPAVSDTVNYLTFAFMFSYDWAGLTKSAIFTKGTDVYEVVLTDDQVLESDHVNLTAGTWSISVVGDTVVDAVVTRQITTSSYDYTVEQSSATSGGVFPPSVASQVYVNVNQATPQTFVGGIPKLAADRVIDQDNELSDKKYVDDKVATVTADDFNHNDLSNKQGGTTGQYYHVTAAEKTVIQNTSGTNTGDQDVSGAISTHNSDTDAHQSIQSDIRTVEAIACGKAAAYTFDTKTAMDAWLLDATNVAKLVVGDNLHIRAVDEYDYWWDGTAAMELEAKAPDLTDYYTKLQVDAAVDPVASQLAAIANKKRLTDDVAAWDALAQVVSIGGLPESLWAHGSSFAKGYTFIMPGYAFRQKGYVRQITMYASASPGNVQLKYKTFRYNYSTATYDIIHDQALVLTVGAGDSGTKKRTINLGTPLLVETGDIPGMYAARADGLTWEWILNGGGRTAINDTLYVNADVVAAYAFSSTSASVAEVEFLGDAPFAAFTGDSIFEGHNTAGEYHGTLHDAITSGTKTIPGGILTSEPAFMTSFASEFAFNYQNLALGSKTFAWVASTGIVACMAVKPHTVVILCGVNDISTGRTWADVETDLDTIKTAFDAGVSERLMICEILPWTAATDAQAATLRTFNANLATWCTANGATLIKTHDKLAQIRASTRMLDDLKTEYNHDNVHLEAPGVAKLGEIIYQAMIS